MRRKAFLFTFLVLSLLLAACVRSGGTEGENSYTIYYPAAELRDVPGEDDASEPVGPRQLGAGGLLAAVCAPCGH